jgi:hypothetical protein
VTEVPQEMYYGTSVSSPAVTETVMKMRRMTVVHQQSPKKKTKEEEKKKPWSFLNLLDLKHTRYSNILKR